MSNPLETLMHLIAKRMGINSEGITINTTNCLLQIHPKYAYYNNHNKEIGLSPDITSKEELVECIAHELVHADQHQRGDLSGPCIWKGVSYRMEYYSLGEVARIFGEEEAQRQYRSLPWEVEANMRASAFTLFVYPNCEELKEVA